MIKLPVMGKTGGLEIRQVSLAPGQGFFSVCQGGITQGATHRKQSELIMLFSNKQKKKPKQQNQLHFQSSPQHHSSYKWYQRIRKLYFPTGKLFKPKLFP